LKTHVPGVRVPPPTMRGYWSELRSSGVVSALGYVWTNPTPPCVFASSSFSKLKGKSLKWARRGRALVLRVGLSHLRVVGEDWDTRVRKAGKVKFVVWGTVAPKVRRWLMAARSAKFPNLYHGRGVRVSRTRLTRKDGKVSAYR
jgi:hypothetical protein